MRDGLTGKTGLAAQYRRLSPPWKPFLGQRLLLAAQHRTRCNPKSTHGQVLRDWSIVAQCPDNKEQWGNLRQEKATKRMQNNHFFSIHGGRREWPRAEIVRHEAGLPRVCVTNSRGAKRDCHALASWTREARSRNPARLAHYSRSISSLTRSRLPAGL